VRIWLLWRRTTRRSASRQQKVKVKRKAMAMSSKKLFDSLYELDVNRPAIRTIKCCKNSLRVS